MENNADNQNKMFTYFAELFVRDIFFIGEGRIGGGLVLSVEIMYPCLQLRTNYRVCTRVYSCGRTTTIMYTVKYFLKFA